MYGCSVDGVDLRSEDGWWEDGMVSFSVHSAGIWYMVYGTGSFSKDFFSQGAVK